VDDETCEMKPLHHVTDSTNEDKQVY